MRQFGQHVHERLHVGRFSGCRRWEIRENPGETSTSPNTDNHRDCASQTSRSYRRCRSVPWIALWHNWQTESWNIFCHSVGATKGSPLRTDVLVFSDSVIVRRRSQRRCKQGMADQGSRKCETLGDIHGQVPYHGPTSSISLACMFHQALQSMREIQTFLDPRDNVIPKHNHFHVDVQRH